MANEGEPGKMKAPSIKGFCNTFQIVADDGEGRFGGAEGIRTPDLRSAIAALSQLSYGPAAHNRTQVGKTSAAI